MADEEDDPSEGGSDDEGYGTRDMANSAPPEDEIEEGIGRPSTTKSSSIHG